MAKKPAYRAGRDQAATAENVELLTGQRGDRLDKAVTFRELSALGLSTLRPGAGGVYVPGKNPDLFPAGQMEFPHAPVNVIANGAFHTVLVEWDPPRYRGHAHAEIWRAESDNQAEATLVGTSSANLFSDAIGKGAKFYYWVRFVNGKDDRGPFQGVQGVEAETSREVQDILDELQGKIEESHLAQTLLGPIEQVPQLQLDIAILKPKVDEIEVMRPKVAAIEDKIPGIEQELAGLDERQKVAQELLDDAQQQLGMSSIEIGLVQDRLNAKLDKYKGDFDSFRDAVFVVDPESGSITMDAVNAVREELHTSITEVQQDLDAVAGQISSKADNVTVDGQGSRITEAEQRINGLDASLSQTVTRGEFTGEQQRVTQIGQELDATKGELTQKATQQEVDEQGQRLANAESKLTVHTDELSSQAQRLDGLAAQITQGDETLQASITELARVSAESEQVTAQRVSGLEVRAGESEAKIQVLEEIIDDSGGITAGRLDSITAELELQSGHDEANASAAIDGALSVDERARENRTAFGEIRTEQRVILTEQQAQAQRITDMAVRFDGKDADTQARIALVEKVASDADRALGERVATIDATVGESVASITELQRAVVSNAESISQRQGKLESEVDVGAASLVEGALAGDERDRENRKARGVILQQQSTLANQQEAQARTVEQLTAEFDAETADLKAQITNEQLARATANEALSQQISTVDAAFKAADTALSASLSESSKALADADRALGERISTLDVTVGENSASITELQQAVVSNEASLSQRQDKMESEIGIGAISQVEGALAGDKRDRENRKARGVILQQQSTLANQQEAQARTVEQLTAEFYAETADLKAQITNEQLARSTANEALGSQINTVSAVAGSKNKTFFQATAPESGMGTGDLWFDTASNNRPYRYSGTAWIATDDPRIAANAASIQTQSQAIANLQNGAQAMWSAKASAGQITAGIGLIAKSDGTSQVMVSASQFFVFNPNSPNSTAPLFAIDNGRTVIAEAIIRKATIQILTSEKITADYIKAGVSISAPLINGGQIDMGNAFMADGAAGFGKGGPYGGWGWSWHTIIYADGGIYTDRLYASNGSFTGTVNANAGTFHNVTIEETCEVKGTVYANKIVGDVLSAKVVSANSTDSAGSGHVVASASVKGSRTHAANLYCIGVTVEVYASGGYQSGGNDQDVPATISGRLVLKNTAGSIIATAPFKASSGSRRSVDAISQSITIQGGFNVGTGAASMSVAVIIDSQSASYGGSAGVRVPAQSIAFCLLPSGSQFN